MSTFTTTIIAMLSFQSFNVQLLTATMKKTESRIVKSSHHDNQRKDPSASRHSQCFPTHSASCRQVSEQYKLSLRFRFTGVSGETEPVNVVYLLSFPC